YTDGLIYTSTNSGVSWTKTAAPINGWSAVASSADGVRLVAADSASGDGLVYTSADSGVTWTQASAPYGDRKSTRLNSSHGSISYSTLPLHDALPILHRRPDLHLDQFGRELDENCRSH